ncbi:MAG: rhodanese-like domain-containing protein [Bacteroidia bacterium]|jgi:rhodanese-related sulfurtransferase|nr:rhodanese-like domain-containing protein [Bacteroidia bacterium]
MKEVTVQELRDMIQNKVDFQLIDVREEYEFDAANLGGELIPLATVIDQADRISKTKPVIIHCRSGARSAAAVRELESRFGFENLANLKGGILAWAKDIDPSLQVS